MRPATRDVRDDVLLVAFPDFSEGEANRAAVALGRRLRRLLGRGLLDAIPGARSLLVVFEPERLARRRLGAALSRESRAAAVEEETGRLLRIPVAYGGEAALDLPALARGIGIAEQEFTRRHAAAEYRVAFMGFAPGFPYLVGLPAELHAARLPSPRPRVSAGSVAIGGSYTGIYPAPSPGGWRLIGRTSVSLFEPRAERPALLAAGDRVRFEAVGLEDLPPAKALERPAPRGRPILRVLAPGLFTTIQGAPHPGLGASGVPAGGAMDSASLADANALVENLAGEPALEMALVGPELEAVGEAAVALSGGDLSAEWNGRPAPLREPFRLAVGDRLRFGRARDGARAYLAVRGGIADSHWPGEASPPLAADETIFTAESRQPTNVPDAAQRPRPPAECLIRVVLGPEAAGFAAAEIERFLTTSYEVSRVSDRRGLRLEGEPLRHTGAPEIPPSGTVPGTIQVPGGGLPIVLGPDGPVTGGYPRIATVIAADLPLLGQAAPGTILRFRAVSLEDALRARRG